MANVGSKIVNDTSYSYDMESKNSLGLRHKILMWSGKLVYDKTKIESVPLDDGGAPAGVKTPVITITEDGTVTITCATSGATIYYTTDGSAPDNTSTAYSAAFTVPNHTTVKAIAYAMIEEEEKASSVASKTYSVATPQVATPTFSPAAGAVDSGTSVTISCTTVGATIYYTDDGSAPSSSSTEYSGAITLTSAKTLKAIAIKEGMDDSNVATAAYTINVPTVAKPTFSPNGGSVESGATVTISCATDGAVIHYTDDGSNPTASSPVYDGTPITISSAKTFKAIGVKEGYNDSSVATASFTIKMYKYLGVFNNPDEDTDIMPDSTNFSKENLENLAGLSKVEATTKNVVNFTFTGVDDTNNGRYIYAYPTSLGSISTFKDGSGEHGYEDVYTRFEINVDGVPYYVFAQTDSTGQDSDPTSFQ